MNREIWNEEPLHSSSQRRQKYPLADDAAPAIHKLDKRVLTRRSGIAWVISEARDLVAQSQVLERERSARTEDLSDHPKPANNVLPKTSQR
jgi:hypothetical protein